MLNDVDRAIIILCVEHNLINRAECQRIVDTADGSAAAIDMLLDLVPSQRILPLIAPEFGIAFCDLHSKSMPYHVEQALLENLDVSQLIDHAALPLVDVEGRVVVAMANPNDVVILDYLASFFPGHSIVLADQVQVQSELLRFGSSTQVDALAAERVVPLVQSVMTKSASARSPMIDYVDNIFNQAIAQDASDVHLETNQDHSALLRYRIDGQLIVQRQPPIGREIEIVGTILARANMNSQNLLEPQDGTFSFAAAGRRIDCRVSFLPQENGPGVVTRLLDSSNMNRRLDDMGFLPEHLQMMRRAMSQSQGTIVICGPTGSGKTTTLYGLLKEVDAVHSKVVTIEDPVEYRLPYVGQTQVRTGLGARSLTFARVLRALLRQDPDVILVGECRDQETAQVATEAAITGHLVLTTVHAPSAPAVYTRLIEMGVPAYSVAESITLTVSQRLLRRVHECAEARPTNVHEAEVLSSLGITPPETSMYPTGCTGCRGTGYRGRIAAVEVLRPTLSLRRLIVARAPLEDIVADAKAHGFVDILTDGMRHVNSSLTSIAEVLRVLERSQDSELGTAPTDTAADLAAGPYETDLAGHADVDALLGAD
jgi:type II secretory ATPase GspE/PulE/Tfp pilus assembly ATPase PilB-like protein